jgi:hypothetical protein
MRDSFLAAARTCAQDAGTLGTMGATIRSEDRLALFGTIQSYSPESRKDSSRGLPGTRNYLTMGGAPLSIRWTTTYADFIHAPSARDRGGSGVLDGFDRCGEP